MKHEDQSFRTSHSAIRILSGGVCAPAGFLTAGVAAGIKPSGDRDLALIVSEELCHAAGTFTTNSVKAASVLLDLQKIRRPIRGVVISSGNANACTGHRGFQNAKAMAEMAVRAVDGRGFDRGNFLVCSTGRIGVQLPMKKIADGIRQAAARLGRNDQPAARAIMTTDTYPKKTAVELRIGGRQVRIGGMAKGAGMIGPGMSSRGNPPALAPHATMLCFLTTDAVISRALLQECLNRAVAQSFNRITVDGDMSPNDTVLLLANGCAGNRLLRTRSADLRSFQSALDHATLTLAKMIVHDGEGISKVVTLEVIGAASASDAERAVRAVGNSALVKCSWCGEDANWGRISAAIGYSGARFHFSRFTLKYDRIPLISNGLLRNTSLKRVHRILRQPDFSIQCDLGLGKYSALLYTTDLTEEYVRLNKGE